MNRILFLLVIFLFFSCKNQESSDTIKSSPSIIILEKNQTGIHNDNFEIVDTDLLYGKWIHTKGWTHMDDSWNAYKYFDYSREYIFTRNQVFYYNEKEKGETIAQLQGVFQIDTSGHKIAFLFTLNNDTILNPGEKCKIFEREVYLLNDTILRMREDYTYSSDKYLDIGEYYRQ